MNRLFDNLEEKYTVKASLNVSGTDIPDVPCKIFLPVHNTYKPLLKFFPSEEQFTKITTDYVGSFQVHSIGFYDKEERCIYSPKVYFSEMEKNYLGPDYCDCSLTGEPQHLQIIEHLHSDTVFQNTVLTLWITSNSMLEPAISSEYYLTGDIKCKRVRQLNFKMTDKINISFDKHFQKKQINKDTFSQWSYLVGITEIGIPAKDVDITKGEILPHVDDFLLIASLGSLTRTACIGWQACDNNNLVTYYRGEYVFPTEQSVQGIEEGLVDLKHFEDFLKICYPKFLAIQDKDAIRKAINSIVHGRSKLGEEDFLSMYAGLESILLAFRKENNLETVISDKKEWQDIKDVIRKNIFNTIKQKLSRDQRHQIYKKIDELNRVPLSVAFESYCNYYNIDLSDLWPLFKTNNSIGLSDIRNKLIHGDHFADDPDNAFCAAIENLRLILQRVLVKVLGFPLDKTKVSSGYLKKNSYILKTMENDQKAMLQILQQNSNKTKD